MNDQYDQIRQKVKEATLRNVHHNDGVSTASRKNFLTKFLGSCILILSLGIVIAFLGRTSTPVEHFPDVRPSQPEVVETPSHVETALSQVAKEVGGIQQKLESLTKRVLLWEDRTWLLSVAHNENTNIQAKINKKLGVTEDGYIVFDHEWKINHAPKTFPLDERSQKVLDGFVKENPKSVK